MSQRPVFGDHYSREIKLRTASSKEDEDLLSSGGLSPRDGLHASGV